MGGVSGQCAVATPSAQPAGCESGSWSPLKGKNEKQLNIYRVLDAQTLFWSQDLG